MAIQNFLAGGFYGKLGDVVGQRWHNKRTLRKYVVGENPNTPAQQLNRQLFARSIELAQKAMNINKGAPAWSTVESTEFSKRVGTARLRLKAGLSLGQSLPIVPDDYIPLLTLPTLSLGVGSGLPPNALVDASLSGDYDREIILFIHVFNINSLSYDDFYIKSIMLKNSSVLIPISILWQNAFINDSYIYGASINDGDFANQTIFIPYQEIKESPVAHRVIELTLFDSMVQEDEIQLWLEPNHYFSGLIEEIPVLVVLDSEDGPTELEDICFMTKTQDGLYSVSLEIPEGYYWGEDSEIGPFWGELEFGNFIIELDGEAVRYGDI